MQSIPPTSKPSILKRFIGWLFSWRTIRRTLIILVALVTLAVALVTEENWRGRRAWESYKSSEEAKGEKFDLASFTPPPLPENENFAATPALAQLVQVRPAPPREGSMVERISLEGDEANSGRSPSLGNWRRGEFCNLTAWQGFYATNTNFLVAADASNPAAAVLSALKKYEPVVRELTAASQRPYASLPFRREMVSSLSDSLNPFSTLKALTRVFTLRALANLQAGRSGDALSDIKVTFRLAESLEAQPTLIVHLVRMALLEIALQPVWEGLGKNSWDAAQLRTLQTLIGNPSMLARYGIVMRGERAFGNAMLEEYRTGKMQDLSEAGIHLGVLGKFTGKAMLYHNQIALNRLIAQAILPAVETNGNRVFVDRANTNAFTSVLSKRNPYNFLAWMSAAALVKSPERFARVQTSLDLATLACALERYRLVHHAYPEALGNLTPQFIEQVPLDVIDGKPLKFRHDRDRLVLYSVGWNQSDESGEIGVTRGGKQDFEKGDWVWLVSPPK
jgi:hypothetical protein